MHALTRIAKEESADLCSIIESPDTTEEQRQKALMNLHTLVRSLELRLAELEQVASVRPDGAAMSEPPKVA